MNASGKYLYPVAALCAAAIIILSMVIPGARLSFLLPAAAVCGAGVCAAYRATPMRTHAGLAVLIVAYTLVVCGIIVNINYFTVASGGTYAYPVLHNYDAFTDWSYAVNFLDGDPVPTEGILPFRYISYLYAAIMALFGRDIGVLLMFNSLCYGLTIILVGAIAMALTDSKKISTVSMVVTALMCYLMVQATVIIKDVPLTMCVAAFTLVMIRWRNSPRTLPSDCCLLLVALVGIAFMRANFLLMLLLGIAIFSVHLHTDKFPFFRVDRRFVALFALVLIAFFLMHNYFSFASVEKQIAGSESSGVFVQRQNVRAWDAMLSDDYWTMPVWKRLMWLPASVIVQFLIPFPWNFERDMIFGPTEAVAHFGYFWYYAGAVLLYWIFAARKGSPVSLKLLALWGIILTVITAYMMSGRVSRYCLIYLPMLLPAVAFTLVRCYQKKSLWVWLGVFTALLVPVLIVCHHLQSTA